MRVFKVLLLSLCTFATTLLFLSETAFASRINMPDESCTPVDVRDAMSPELRAFFMKPSHQGNIGWCYGYAAADVLSQKLGTPISAVHVSANYTSRITGVGRWAREVLYGQTPTPDGGFIGGAIKDMRKHGTACTTTGVPYAGVFDDATQVGILDYIGSIESFFKGTCSDKCNQTILMGIIHSRNLESSALNFNSGYAARPLLQADVNSSFTDKVEALYQLRCDKDCKTSVLEELQKARSSGVLYVAPKVAFAGHFVTRSYDSPWGMADFLASLQSLREGTCEERCPYIAEVGIKHYMPRLSVESVKKYLIDNPKLSLAKAFFALTDSSCAKERVDVPKDISIESTTQQIYRPENDSYEPTRDIIYRLDRALEKNKVVGFEYNAKYITPVGGIFGGFHASSIMGRKTIGNKCHYLVRNSWGKSCNYKKGVICERDQGGYWVDAKTLRHMTSKLVWIND